MVKFPIMFLGGLGLICALAETGIGTEYDYYNVIGLPDNLRIIDMNENLNEDSFLRNPLPSRRETYVWSVMHQAFIRKDLEIVMIKANISISKGTLVSPEILPNEISKDIPEQK